MEDLVYYAIITLFFFCFLASREWVTRLFYDKGSKTIMALTDDIVYIISVVTRQQIEVFYNTHRSSLSYCTFYQPLQYFITAASDGTVHIYHTGILQKLVTLFFNGVSSLILLFFCICFVFLHFYPSVTGGSSMWCFYVRQKNNTM